MTASPYLREIFEPIALERAIAIDDGGSKDLAFRDAGGRKLAFSLVCFDLREWGSNKPHQIAFDVEGEERFVPVRGPDERVLLGLLERWAKAAGVGQELADRYRRFVRREIDAEAFTQGRGDRAYSELVAYAVLKQLRER